MKIEGRKFLAIELNESEAGSLRYVLFEAVEAVRQQRAPSIKAPDLQLAEQIYTFIVEKL